MEETWELAAVSASSMNSAQKLLNMIRSLVENEAYQNMKLSDALVEEMRLPLSPDELEYHSVDQFIDMVESVRKDIQSVNTTEENRTILNNFYLPFSMVAVYSSINTPVQTVMRGLFSAGILSNLNLISMALDGKIEREDLTAELTAFIDDLDALRDSFSQIELPSNLKKSIDIRMGQLRSSITHFKYSGLDGLENALIGLTGEIVLYHEQFSKKDKKKLLLDFGSFASSIKKQVTKARGYEKDAAWVLERAGDVGDLAKKIIGSTQGL